jgi:hypothetical protein
MSAKISSTHSLMKKRGLRKQGLTIFSKRKNTTLNNTFMFVDRQFVTATEALTIRAKPMVSLRK